MDKSQTDYLAALAWLRQTAYAFADAIKQAGEASKALDGEVDDAIVATTISELRCRLFEAVQDNPGALQIFSVFIQAQPSASDEKGSE